MRAQKPVGKKRKPRQPKVLTPEQARLLAELKVLAARSAEEWVQRIAQLDDALRIHVGCIVWWDYFAHYKRPNPAFAQYLDGWKVGIQCSNEKLVYGLQQLGYPASTAAKRIMHGT